VIGDEAPYPSVKRREVGKVIGDRIQGDLPVEEMIAELERTYDTYYVIPKMTSHWGNQSVHRRWVKLLGQNVLTLEDPAGICELIASTVGLAEGKVDLEDVADALRETGSSQGVARVVQKALAGVSHERGGSGPAVQVPESGDGSGLSRP